MEFTETDKLNGYHIFIDEASLNISNCDDFKTLDLWMQSEECFTCSPWKYLSLKPGEESFLKVNSTYLTNLYIRLPNGHRNLHSYKFHFVQHGEYSLNFNSSSFLPIHIRDRGDNEYMSIIAAFLFFFLLYAFWLGAKSLERKMEEDRRCVLHNAEDAVSLLDEDQNGTGVSAASGQDEVGRNMPDSTTTATRLKSLDTFRGLTVVLMIFVNYGGGKYYFFKHSPWNGLTVADLVFPWFLWIMGLSLTFSIRSQLRRMTPYYVIMLRILKRSFVLFALGIVLNSLKSNHLPQFRVMGVLQRFSFCYLINALLETWRMKPQESTEYFRCWWLRDLVWAWAQWAAVGVLVVGHAAITLALQVPGCPTGYLGPGGLHATGKYPNCTGGAAGYVDRLVLGDHHIYRTPSCRTVYDCSTYEPEGILGILTSCLVVQFGVAAGRIILYFPSHSHRLKRWIVWGVALGLVGGLLCGWNKESGFLPVNKNLWSLSYVCVTSSFAFILLAALYFWIDAKRLWNGTILRIAGMNPILLYVGHEVTRKLFPWSWSPVPQAHSDHLAMNIWGTCLWLVAAYFCHAKKFYLSV